MKNWIYALILILLAFMLGIAVRSRSSSTAGGRHDHSAATAPVRTTYICPMHPTVTSDKPDAECPICGMRLIPMDEYRKTSAGSAGTVPGMAEITVPAEIRQRISLTMGRVEQRNLTRTIRTSARLVADETRIFKVNAKIGGWVENLFASVTGQAVRKGDPLLSIYSPELVAAQQEYLSALQAVAETPTASSSNMAAATGQRLRLWDIGADQIARLEKNGQPEKTMTLTSPVGGFVMEKMVTAGQKIMPGDPLFVVADLTNIWAEADIYQSDLPFVKEGMPVEISVPQSENTTFTGKVTFVSPVLNPETRTLKARMEIANPLLLLKPGMFADAGIRDELGLRLAVPESAVMRTDKQAYVFRDGGEGKLTPVEIKTGARSDGYYEVLSGLKEGDSVVTSANFLVDSESSLRAALEAMEK